MSKIIVGLFELQRIDPASFYGHASLELNFTFVVFSNKVTFDSLVLGELQNCPFMTRGSPVTE